MDDIYHNDAVNHTMEDNTENTAENGYQQPCQDSYQRSVEEQLRYQYQEPESDLEEPVSVGEWLVSMLLMLIPCVNIVLMFVWAFSSREKRSKSNYFKATLIFAAIILVIYIIFIAIFGVAISSAIANANF